MLYLKAKLILKLQAVAVKTTLHRAVDICSIFIKLHNPINKNKLNGLMEQLPKHFTLLGYFNSHNYYMGM